MADSLHPAASHHLPMFITPPGETDVLMIVLAVVLALSVLGFGVFFFRLHSLPEHLAHKGKKMQAELVAVLCLVSLFTHMHIFWIAGLLLAMIDLPDFGTPMRSIADSVERIADSTPGAPTAEPEAEPELAGHAGAMAPAKQEVRTKQEVRGHA